jgi:tetratricopeptide (TPR) repeat protein
MDLAAAPRMARRGKPAFANTTAYQALTRWSLYLLFFLLPIFFLPFTVDAFEVNKQTLLVILTFVALVAWLGSMVVEKRLAFRTGWLNLFPALLLVGVLVSSIFSLAGYQTWVGQASQEYTSFLTIAVSVLLFYVLMNGAGETRVQRNIFLALLLAATLSGLVTLAYAFGWQVIPGVNIKGFNPVGTVNAFVTFLSIVSCLGIGLWLVGNGKNEAMPEGGAGKLTRVLIVLTTLIDLVLLAAIDFWVLWVVMIFGMLLLLAFAFLQQSEFGKPTRFAAPLLVLIVSVLLLFLPSPLRLNLPVVVSPSYGSSLNIATSVLSESPQRTAFGSGPGTFAFDYAKYKPQGVNSTAFWNLRFDRSKSHVLTTLATLGVAGAILWVLLVLVIAARALGRLIRERDHAEWKMTYVLFAAWAALVLALALYSSNMTLTFLFWGLSGLLASQVAVNVKETDFARSPKLGLISSFAFVLVAVGVLTALFVTGQRYASEVAFAQAVKLDRTDAPTAEVVEKLGQAVSFNSLSDVYYRNLSQALLLRTRDVLSEVRASGAEMTAEQTAQVQQLVSAAINSTARATAIATNNVANWSVRGNVYREVMSLVSGAEDYAAASYQRAIELEPLSPLHYTNLGQLHIIVADRARALTSSENAELAKTAAESEVSELAAAEEALTKAIQLKPDYAPAHYYLAAVYERQGRLADATARLAALRNYSPLDVGLGFQLAMMYLRLQQYDLAQAELERIVGLAPNYSNALWYLASLYEIDGDLGKALQAIEKVAQSNPDNQGVQDRLTKLRAGELTTVIPEPVESGEESATTVEGGEVTAEEETEEETVPSEEETLIDEE